MSNSATLVAENTGYTKNKRFDRQARKAHKSFRSNRKNKRNLWIN